MAQQQGEYEKFLGEERRRKGLEDEFGAFVQEQERKRGAPADPLDDLIDEFIASQRKARPAQTDPLDDVIDEVMATPSPSPSATPLPRPSPGRVLMPTERQEFNYRRPLDLDTSLKQASQRRIKAEGALVERSKKMSAALRPDWRTAQPTLHEPVIPGIPGPKQGPTVFAEKRREPAPARMKAEAIRAKAANFNAADLERSIVETVSDPSNASNFTADEWAAMQETAQNVAQREAEERTQGRLRDIESQQQRDKAVAPSYPVQLANRFLRGATGMVTSSMRGASLLHPAIAADLRQKGVLQSPQEMEDTMRTLAPVDPTDESLLAKGAEALGSAVPFIGASAMGGAAGLPAWIVPSVLGAASNAGQTYDEAVAAGQDPEKAKRAAIIGALIGLTEGLGVGRLGGGHAASHGLLRTITGEFLEEGFQEGFLNQALNNINAKIVSGYDPNRAISEGVLESFGLGGFVGGTFGAVAGGRPSQSERYRATLNAKPMEAIRPPASMIPPATPAANTAPISASAPSTARLPQIAPEPQLGQTTRRLQAPPVRAEAGLPELAEIETAPTAPALKVAPARASVVGPRLNEAALNVGTQGAPAGSGETPSLGKAIGAALRTSSQAMRTFWTSMDFSAPMSQGAILSIAHPIKASRSFKAMFRSLSAKQSAAIDDAIINHPLLPLGEDSGLYVATTGKAKGAPEEFFAIEALNKLPGIRHSERAYRSYLDTLRLSTWESYVKSLQRSGFTPENNPKAYRQAAEFINIATGRGSLRPGGKLEKAMDLGGDILFAPRNLVANFQLLDPVRYASLSPGARKLVLRDATTAFGSMLATAALLSAAGVKVGFNPERDDFMTARWGDTRYDLTFGKRTQVQFLARMMAGVYRKAEGSGNLPGRDPLSVAGRFAQGKLAPVYSTALTFARGRDYKGESISNKSIGKIAWETAAPLLWRDLVEAYQQEGIKGVAKAQPAIFGAHVSTYPDRASPEWLPTSEEVRAEQKRLGLPRTFLTPLKHETAEVFRARHQRTGQAFASLADEMVRSPDYWSADDEIRREAFAGLKRYLQASGRRPTRERSVEQIISAAAESVARRKTEKEEQ
jgi:hypothetical protein